METPRLDKPMTVEEREKAFNDGMKKTTRLIGRNMDLIICAFILILPILMIWVEMGEPILSPHMVSDAVLRIFMFIVAEHCMIKVGVTSGKMDEEHLKYRAEYLDIRQKTYSLGVLLLQPFCDWQIDKEFLQAKKTACRRIGVKHEQYESDFCEMDRKQLRDRLGITKGAGVFAINKMKPIELTPELLLTDGMAKYARGGVPKSGEEYAHERMYGKLHLVLAVICAIVTILPNFQNVEQITWASVVTAFVNIIAVIWRMGTGYSNGVKAFNDIEIKHLQAKIRYLQFYHEYLRKKIYLKFGDKYGNIDEFLAEGEEEDFDLSEIQGQQSYEEGVRTGD